MSTGLIVADNLLKLPLSEALTLDENTSLFLLVSLNFKVYDDAYVLGITSIFCAELLVVKTFIFIYRNIKDILYRCKKKEDISEDDSSGDSDVASKEEDEDDDDDDDSDEEGSDSGDNQAECDASLPQKRL